MFGWPVLSALSGMFLYHKKKSKVCCIVCGGVIVLTSHLENEVYISK